MDLAWIAAIYTPYELAPHPNFSSEQGDIHPAAALAGIVIGPGPWRDSTGKYASNPWLHAAVLALDFDTQEQGVLLLSDLVTRESDNPAIAVSFALIACLAAAERDDYRTCDELLTELIRSIDESTPQGRLLLAILHQQRALRRRDYGREYISDSTRALSLLSNLQPETLGNLPLNAGTAQSSSAVFREIVYALRQSCWSAAPPAFSTTGDAGPFPSWRERVASPRSELLLTVSRDSAREYSRWLEGEVKNQFGTTGVTIGGFLPDLFHATMRYELLGDFQVIHARKQIANLRIRVSNLDPKRVKLSDCIRLFRHAGADSDLNSILQRLSQSGPNSPIVDDARAILRGRSDPLALRTSEMIVLRASAEFMSPDAAFDALSVVLDAIRAGMPAHRPGSWQLDVKRLESAWMAAVALANASGAQVKILDELTANLRLTTEDELWDNLVGRVVGNLEWDRIERDHVDSWSKGAYPLLEANSASASAIRNVHQQKPSRADSEIQNLSDVVESINWHIRAERPFSRDLVERATEICIQQIEEKRERAASGIFGRGAYDIGDIAALLVSESRDSRLTEILVRFLFDTRVDQSDRSSGFDRLVRSGFSIPHSLEGELRLVVDEVIDGSGAQSRWFDSASPYPAAVRFAFSAGLITGSEAMAYLSRLASVSSEGNRREAANCVAAFSLTSQSSWIRASAYALTRDEDPRTRAYAARALAILAQRSDESDLSVWSRLAELMVSDGIAAPLAIVGEMRQISVSRSEEFRAALEWARSSHSSRRVRDSVGRLLAHSPQE
ncbi:hypothetical protein [Rhodococcus triatomae]